MINTIFLGVMVIELGVVIWNTGKKKTNQKECSISIDKKEFEENLLNHLKETIKSV